MPIEMPWARRRRLQIESRPGCAGAVDYSRRMKLILDEFLRITNDVTRRGVFRQQDYSYILGLIQEHGTLNPPPAAGDFHAAVGELLHTTRSGIGELDPGGNHDLRDINRVFNEAERILEHSVVEPWERFNAVCFPDQANASSQTPVRPRREVDTGVSVTIAQPDSIDPSAVERPRLARYLRLKSRSEVERDLEDLAPLASQLDRLASRPEGWTSLDQGWLSLLNFYQMLRYAYAGVSDPDRMALIINLYFHSHTVLGTRARLALEDEVAKELDSEGRHWEAISPFMLVDPDPAVISTAAIDIASLIPLRNGNELTGPSDIAQEALRLADTDETRAAAMIAGLLLMGDARILPYVAGSWSGFGQAGKDILRERQSGTVSAAGAEFFLDWIDSVDENDFGHPAGALARMAELARRSAVRDQRRKFPAPFNLSDEEFLADLPIKLMQSWSVAEFALVIEPRLRIAFQRETYDKVMPRVLEAWGLAVGVGDREAQERLLVQSYEASASKLVEFCREVASSEPIYQETIEAVAETFSTHSAPIALFLTLQEVWALQREASEAREQAQESPVDGSNELIVKAMLLDDRAEKKEEFLRRFFGPFPQNVGTTLGTMALLWPKHRPGQCEGVLPDLSWVKQVPMPLWPAFVEATFVHLLSDAETTAATQAEETMQEIRSRAVTEDISNQLRQQADETLTEARAMVGAAVMAKQRGANVDIASLILRAFVLEAKSRALRARAEK